MFVYNKLILYLINIYLLVSWDTLSILICINPSGSLPSRRMRPMHLQVRAIVDRGIVVVVVMVLKYMNC